MENQESVRAASTARHILQCFRETFADTPDLKARMTRAHESYDLDSIHSGMKGKLDEYLQHSFMCCHTVIQKCAKIIIQTDGPTNNPYHVESDDRMRPASVTQ